MKIYQVGGVVRDKYLGIASKDIDWLVVGATESEMLALGYKQVGKNFPVYLHPETKQEYALARTEKKTAPGYSGFDFYSEPSVTLEDDLKRRDLTINAIAETADGKCIDPYHGIDDLNNKILRHVSPAFAEDPVRILRIARFAARFFTLGFTIADQTLLLMKSMVQQGEVDSLVEERIWQELHSCLTENHPEVFFEVLRECGALKRIFPELDNLYGVPQPAQYHPEIDTGIHTMMVLQQACLLSNDCKVRFAALVHDLGKAVTPRSEWPKHIQHENRGVALVKTFCCRFKVPNAYRELAIKVTQYHLHYHRIAELKATTILKTLQALNGFRAPEQFENFVLACEADSRGRTGYENTTPIQSAQFRAVFNAALNIDIKAITADEKNGAKIGKLISQARLNVITECIKEF